MGLLLVRSSGRLGSGVARKQDHRPHLFKEVPLSVSGKGCLGTAILSAIDTRVNDIYCDPVWCATPRAATAFYCARRLVFSGTARHRNRLDELAPLILVVARSHRNSAFNSCCVRLLSSYAFSCQSNCRFESGHESIRYSGWHSELPCPWDRCFSFPVLGHRQ